MNAIKFFKFIIPTLLLSGLVFISSCKDDEPDPDAPTITLSAASFSGKTGEMATTTATVTAPGGLASFTVTKFLGLDADPSFGTSGTMAVTSPYTLNYDLAGEGLDTPVRFAFAAEDDNGKTASVDFVVTTEASVEYLLTNFNWQWKSKLGKCLESEPETEQIVECETDNVFTFNADGTMSIDYGAQTGSGGGTCDFDGVVPETSWELNADESALTITKINAFDPNDIRMEVYNIVSADAIAIESTSTIDLTVFGCIVYDWTFVWSGVPQ